MPVWSLKRTTAPLIVGIPDSALDGKIVPVLTAIPSPSTTAARGQNCGPSHAAEADHRPGPQARNARPPAHRPVRPSPAVVSASPAVTIFNHVSTNLQEDSYSLASDCFLKPFDATTGKFNGYEPPTRRRFSRKSLAATCRAPPGSRQ